MGDTNYFANLRGEPLKVWHQGLDKMPAPVVNVTSAAGRSNRVEALHAALTYHRDHQDDTVPDVEDICGTAGVFEYFLEKGEYPPG